MRVGVPEISRVGLLILLFCLSSTLKSDLNTITEPRTGERKWHLPSFKLKSLFSRQFLRSKPVSCDSAGNNYNEDWKLRPESRAAAVCV